MTSVALDPDESASVRLDRRTVVFAWLVTLSMSSLPAIIAVELTDVRPVTAQWATLVAVVPLSAVAWRWRPARPVRRYLFVMLAVFCVAYLLLPLIGGWVGAGELTHAFFNKTLFVLVAAALAGILVTYLGLRPSRAFLTVGNMSAPSGTKRPGRSRPANWAVLGPVAVVALFTLMATVTWLDAGLEPAALDRLVPLLPLVIGCAAFNALGEEVVYRSGPLATLVGVVSSRQAVLLTSVWFGLAHYFGSVPEGFGGVLQSGVLALLLGSAMVATRGLGWPFLMHFAVDLVVFASIAVVLA
jgi:membrane protease YdiL (CAAX protease family)